MSQTIEHFENERWAQRKAEPPRFSWQQLTAAALIQNGPVLDYGCGNGAMLSLLKSKEIPSEGADISEEAVHQCMNAGLTARKISPHEERLPFANKQFDTVVMLDVLEHLFAPDRVLKEIHRIGRHFIVACPNFNALTARLRVLMGKVPENMQPHKGHVQWINARVLTSLLVQNGFHVDRTERYYYKQNNRLMKFILTPFYRLFPDLLSTIILIKAHTV